MNYRFLSVLALVASMYTLAKAERLPAPMEKSQQASSNSKIGCVDLASILESLPEAKKNHAEIQSFQKQVENQIQTKAKEYQEKAEAFQQQANSFTEAQKKKMIAEIYKLELDYKALHEQQYAKMQEKYKTVMQPLNDKIQEVINRIADEYGYTFILSKGTEAGPVILFANQSFDLSELVLERLSAMAPKEVQPPVIASKAQSPTKLPARSTKPTKKNKSLPSQSKK